MSTQRFSEMTEQQFDQLIDQYINRAAQDEADVPAAVFFDLLAQRLSQRVDQPVTLLVDVENHDLTLRRSKRFPMWWCAAMNLLSATTGLSCNWRHRRIACLR